MIYALCFLLANLISSYEWQNLPSPEIKAYAHTVVYDPADDLFFIMGGDSTGGRTNMDICLVFDPKTNTWYTKTSMPTVKRGHSATYRNGFIHVLCGVTTSENRLKKHEVYNINSDSWDTAAPAPIAVSRPGVATWRDSLIYFMGGFDSYNARTEVYYYNPQADSWHSATSLPRPLHAGGVKIKGDSIFIVGGADGSSGFSRILLGEINPANPTDINWSWGDSLPTSINHNNGFAIKNNKLYLIGGAFNIDTNGVWKYDIPSQSWTSLPDYPTNYISRGDFAERRDGADSSGIVYSFMGDTSQYSIRNPTDECYRLVITRNDAGMHAINSPVSDTTIRALVQVNGTVKNYGANTFSFKTYVNIYDPDLLTAFSDSIQVNDLPPSDTLNIDFGSFQLNKVGPYTVEMFTYVSDDTYPFNDSLTATFYSSDYYWQKISSPGIRTYYHTVVYDPADDLFFIIGGDSTGYGTNMDICLEFEPKTNTWEIKEPMYTAKRGHSASYRKGFIHVLCGVDNYDNRITHHEIYNISSNSWDLAAPAPIPVSTPSVVTWRDSLIYIMGGFDSYRNTRSEVYYYNPESNSWHPATSLPSPYHGGGAKIKGDSIFIVGGGDGSLLYTNILIGELNPNDPSNINWFWDNELPIPENFYNGLAIKDNKLYMIGGAFDMGINEAWEYDMLTETWTSLPDYPTNIVMRGDFAERRNGSDSSGVIYCFMGDTSVYSSENPTDECYRLRRSPFSGIDEKGKLEKNSVSLNSTVFSINDIIVRCSIAERCDLKIHMYDLLGRQVFSHLEKNIASGQHQLNIKENLKNGIYFIRIEAGTTVENAKVILIR